MKPCPLFVWIMLCAFWMSTQGLYASTKTDSAVVKSIKPINVCLVLGGGGAKGTAHIAVLEVLEEAGVPIDMIVGSSVGSMIGAFYADHLDAKKVKEKILHLKIWELLELSYVDALFGLIDTMGGVNGLNLRSYVCDNVCAKYVEELQIPLIIVATDIMKNEVFVIEEGPLATAIHASSALPPVFTPVEMHGRTLVDGAVLEPVPVLTAKKYHPKMIIAVNITSPPDGGMPDNMVYLASKAFDNAYYELSRMQSELADIYIHPDLKGFKLFENERNLEAYEKGKEAAMEALPRIRAKMAALKILSKKSEPESYYKRLSNSLSSKSTSFKSP